MLLKLILLFQKGLVFWVRSKDETPFSLSNDKGVFKNLYYVPLIIQTIKPILKLLELYSTISGYDSLRHIHCPRCGKIMLYSA